MRRGILAMMVGATTIVVGMPSGSATAGDITLISTADDGTKGNDGSAVAAVSDDGSDVILVSVATNLDPSDPDGLLDVYVKDVGTGELTLLSTSQDGTKGNGDTGWAAASPDFTKVALMTSATNLDPGDTDSVFDVYLKDLNTGELTLASAADDGTKGNGDSGPIAVSADGSKVAFLSLATNLDPSDTDGFYDVYVKDVLTGELTLVSTAEDGTNSNGQVLGATFSADFGALVMTSGATNLDPADTDTLFDAYMKDLTTGDVTLVSTADGGTKGNGETPYAYISADGTSVVMDSQSTNLDPADADMFMDVYAKDLGTGDMTLISTAGDGSKGNSDSSTTSVSPDGSRVLFVSQATNLDPFDSDAFFDAYVKDRSSGDTMLVSTAADGTKGNGETFDAHLSADGTAVAFDSDATNLDPDDTDTVLDAYVKDVSGSLPLPCTIIGTPGDDSLRGTLGDDVICGLGGNDRLSGSRGDDLLIGGEGNDALKGNGGADVLRGENGGDRLDTRDSIQGNDMADGGAGVDRCTADPNDLLVGCP